MSYHNKNTEKIANIFSKVLDAEIKAPQQVDLEKLRDYDLIGFGSGIYDGKLHNLILNLADDLPSVSKKNVFIFSTCGIPAFAFNNRYTNSNHSIIRDKLQSKGYKIIGEYSCVGHNTNSFLKYFGGINKGRPDGNDLEKARKFALGIKEKYSHTNRKIPKNRPHK
ncbi:flavodoxin family protein [Patescibacteria group bacterium]